MKKEPLFTHGFVTGTLLNFLLLLNYFLLMVVMSGYSLERFQAPDSLAGLSASMFVIGALAARLFAASLMERVGRSGLLLGGIIFEIAASASYFLAMNIAALLFIRFLHGMSYGVASTAVSTITIALIPEERSGEGIGYFMLSSTLGAAIGPFFGMLLVNTAGYDAVFAVCTAIAALCLAGVLPLARSSRGERSKIVPAEKRGSAAAKGGGRSIFTNVIEARALPISLICLGVFFCYSSVISFIEPYAEAIELVGPATFYFVVYSLVIFVTRPITGRMFDRYGQRSVMIPAFAMLVAGLALLSCASNGASLLVSSGLLGFGFGVIQSSGLAIAVDGVSPRRIAHANTTYYICLDAGEGIGAFVLGFLIPLMGYRGMYLTIAIIAAALFLCYLFAFNRRRVERATAQRSSTQQQEG